jgi:hypothetical protein
MLDEDGTSSQCGDEFNVGVVKEIVLLTSKAGVRLLLDLKDHVPSLDAGSLITLASKLDLGAASDTSIDMDVKDFPVHDGLLAIALLTSVLLLDDLALAVAVRANGLEALDHGAHLAHHCLHSMAIATRASSYGALLASAALALGADDGSLES